MKPPIEAVNAAATVLWNHDPTCVGAPAPTSREEWDEDTEGYLEEAAEALTAALPFLTPTREQIARALAEGYEPDTPTEPNHHDYRAADRVVALFGGATND